MAQSTTITNATSLYITANAVDICGSMSMINWDDSREVSAYFTACGDGARHLTGKRTVTGTLTTYYSETAGEAFKTLETLYENNTSFTIVAAPEGNTSGNEQWSMTALITGSPKSLDATTADANTIAYPFVVQGVPTRSTIA